MGSQNHLHFLLIPLMAQGHLIPMIDIARLLAQRGVRVTIITTPLNANRFDSIINRSIASGLPIKLIQLHFPSEEANLPKGCESLDTLPSRHLSHNFFLAASMLQKPVDQLIQDLQHSSDPISCMISDKYLPWTAHIAFHESVSDQFEPFVVPGLPHRIELTKAQLPSAFNPGSVDLKDMREEIRAAEKIAHGVVINSCKELESGYVNLCRKVKGYKVWCIGPVSLCNTDDIDKAQRGNKPSIDVNQCLKWLDSWASAVIYACLGSLSCVTTPQLIELGLGLEASNRPFIWVIRGDQNREEIEKWVLENGFEERVKGRGLLVLGWAPQVLILSHRAIGGFLTHCGWNSTLEGVCAGVPLITWALFSDQFYNQKFVVQVLKIGVRVGPEVAVKWGEEEKFGVLVKREKVREAVEKVMDEGKEGEERRKKARELGEMAKKAMEQGGSSYLNISLLIEDIISTTSSKQSN